MRFLVLLLICLVTIPGQTQDSPQQKLHYELLASLPDSLGIAGPFTGLLGPEKDILMVAGGANFSSPYWGEQKKYTDRIYLLDLENKSGEPQWIEGDFRLPRSIGYGSSVTTADGIICMGGHDYDQTYSEVFRISWDPNAQEINIETLPNLPESTTHGSAALIGEMIYFSGGMCGLDLETATTNFWGLDLSQLPYVGWKVLPAIPGAARAVHLSVAQHNGETHCIYVISGRKIKDDYHGLEPFELLKDVWEFNPLRGDDEAWQRKADAPVCMMAGPGAAVGQSHIFILGGADGSLIYQADSLMNNHPGFPKTAWAYHTITDTWTNLGEIPTNQVTTIAVKYQDQLLIPSGEIRPRVRTPKIWSVSLLESSQPFGALNYITLIVYLFAMLMVGVYFARRNKNTNDFFRGGQRIPWWAAACSIFATMLSSLTYMSVPAKAYMSNWEYLLGYPMIFLTAILVIYLILPFFRQIDATSAYEYLEKRFNRGARYLGSGFFLVFQVGRMAIVMFLSALALAAITPFTVSQCILIMGVLSIIYCTLGGVEAVIWTDTIQTFVLLSGAVLIFILVIFKLDGGFGEFVDVAATDNKFHMVNWDWDLFSYTTAAFWVIIIGGLGQNLVSYGSDQAVVQRYMTTKNQKKAAKSILTNGLIALPAGLLFFALGTAFYVFYKSNPGNLNPGFQNDAIMPLFIVQEVPAGIAGLIIAGIFAAAQSTISTSMNSTSTAAVTDFFRPFNTMKTERGYLRLARLLTVFFGVAGTSIALIFASADIKSLLDQFFAIIGLFGGALGGMFLLGMFTRKANGTGAVLGAITGAITLYLVSTFTETHVYLYAAVGIAATMISGFVYSLIFRKAAKSIQGLTVYDLRK